MGEMQEQTAKKALLVFLLLYFLLKLKPDLDT
jgi:hypothetical protein